MESYEVKWEAAEVVVYETDEEVDPFNWTGDEVKEELVYFSGGEGDEGGVEERGRRKSKKETAEERETRLAARRERERKQREIKRQEKERAVKKKSATAADRAARLENRRLARHERESKQTEEQREARLEKDRERGRRAREKKKQVDLEVKHEGDERERELRMRRERRQRQKARETPEEREKRLERERERKRLAREKQNELVESLKKRNDLEGVKEVVQGREAELRKRRERRHRREARETEEEREARLEKERERKRKHRVVEQVEMSQEERQRRKEVRRVSTQKRKERRRLEGGVKKVVDEETRRKTKERAAFTLMMKRMNMTAEEKQRRSEQMKQRRIQRLQADPVGERERMREMSRKWRHGLTGEKLLRYKASLARSIKKSHKKALEKVKADPEKWQAYREKRAQLKKARYARETVEERRRRSKQTGVRRATRKLRSWMEEVGVPAEEVDAQTKALAEKMWAKFYLKWGIDPPEGREGDEQKTGGDPGVPPPVAAYVTVGDNGGWPSGKEEDCLDLPSSPGLSPAFDWEEKADTPSLPSTSAGGTPMPECSYCPAAAFSTDAQLRSHLVTHHRDKCWECPKCPQMLLSAAEFTQHYASAHKNTPSQNPPSGVPPLREEGVLGDFLCMKCGGEDAGKFRTRPELYAHVQQSHPACYWPCEGCHLLKYSEKSLKLHRQVCDGPG